MKRSSPEPPKDHVAAVSVSFELAVPAHKNALRFTECNRNGERKRVYDSPAPEHHFHLQYQLLPHSFSSPGSARSSAGTTTRGGGSSRSDVVTFGAITKVYTEEDVRVVRCWDEEEEEEEEEKEEDEEVKDKCLEEDEGMEERQKKPNKRTHFGWRHKHSFSVTEELLLQLYDHTMEVRLWNSREKLAPRARFDRPRAFRLPVLPPSSKEVLERRSDKFPLVRQEAEPEPVVSSRGQRKGKVAKKKITNTSAMSEEEELSTSITEEPHTPTPTTDQSEPQTTKEDEPIQEHEMLNSVVLNHSNIFSHDFHHWTSKSQSRKMLAAEKARREREGVVVLRLNMGNLFATRESIVTKLDTAVENIKFFEVKVTLDSPLMSDAHRHSLNPTMITVNHANSLPTQHLLEQHDRCDPVYVNYQFYNLPPHHTQGVTHSRDITLNDGHVILLNTIDQELLAEYLRGPPLVMEVHDRDRRLDKVREECLFGNEERDELLGTHAFGTGERVSEVVCQQSRPWDPYGVARFNLSPLLTGQRIITLTMPISAGPRTLYSREDARVGPHGRELQSPLPAGEYAKNQSYLTITIELSHPLLPLPSSRPSPPSSLPLSEKAPSSCPFTRLVYVTKVDEPGLILVRRILDWVNESNTTVLGLEDLPRDILSTALSTYKLTGREMEDGECDVITGVQVRDSELSLLLLEGLREDGAISKLWTTLPRHSTQDDGLLRTFYNSGYTFSKRLYGQYDVDLPLISLPHSLSSLTKLPPLFVRGTVSPAALRGLLCLAEMSVINSGGMADLVRNCFFPTCEEISALAAQFDLVPRTANLLSPLHSTSKSQSCSHTPVPDTSRSRTPASERSRSRTPVSENSRSHTPISERSRSRTPVSENSRSHTPVPPHKTGSIQPGFKTGEIEEGEKKEMRRRRRKTAIPPLDMSNAMYERLLREREQEAVVDHINNNIIASHALSEKSAQLPTNMRRRRMKMRSQTQPLPVHLYSSQTYNSTVLAMEKMRAELASHHTHRQLYTYCQDYQSMTFEPTRQKDTQLVYKRETERGRWRTEEGFVYPGVPTTIQSNSHSLSPHPARVQELNQPFKDGLLHANTLKPTVDRLHFSWDQRREDFNLRYRLPLEFGPKLPISIHLAGQSRTIELKHSQKLDTRDWESKVVVKDTNFYTHRRGITSELRERSQEGGEKVLEDILKDPPDKYSLRGEGLRLCSVPPLGVIRNGDSGGGGGGDDGSCGCYEPGPDPHRSLKRDSNVVSLKYHQRRWSLEEKKKWLERHDRDFRLVYHTHSPVSKRLILPLTSSEMCPPLFPSSSSPSAPQPS